MDGFERITGREHDGLVEKCQENGWLKVGGFDWQDDPFLEEYPYEFSRTDSVDRLREALGSGNWAIRQGFCYRDLAFIQQVNGGGGVLFNDVTTAGPSSTTMYFAWYLTTGSL